tara:strand:+ start:180 stop:614 length:435 start_codon:yes stop_codon:yes gene_type:complete
MRKINKIFVHHSASSQKSTTRDMIHQWHLDRGWTGVGYHYVIEADGSMMMGRPFDTVGAHVKNHNRHSIGICVVGNYETEDLAMTPGQEQSLTVLLRGLLDEFNLDAGEIYGHMELGQTACPGQHLFKWVSDWRVGYAKAKRTT